MAEITQTEQILQASWEQHAGDPERATLLDRARRFKRSWIELAEGLTEVRQSKAYLRWDFEDFDSYCTKELHIRKGTAEKLCASFGFLRHHAPRLVEEGPLSSERQDTAPPIPSWQAVDFVARAEKRGAAGENEMAEMRRAVFDEGSTVPALNKRFKEVAFPMADGERRTRQRTQIIQIARKLAATVAEVPDQVPEELVARVEELVSELVERLG